jgi:glycosyltransferase involved in cell wall biosynthesis
MNKVWIVDLEAVDTRYTGEWKHWIPMVVREHIDKRGLEYNVEVVEGDTDIPEATTPGAFLNFGGTNVYKSSQINKIARAFTIGDIKPGDIFLYTDAWNPTIIQLKYMSQLLGIPVKIHALWHAGNYDKNDFLGRLIKDEWVKSFELSLAQAIDYNWFASEYHIELFKQTYGNDVKCYRTGWPMEYLQATIKPIEKEDIILFPHRIAPEKQVEIFRDLAKQLPQYKFIVCQDRKLTKAEYHEMLGKSKIVFSANLQETLGISCYEGLLADAVSLVPDRLSYSEMYNNIFKYPSEWTESYESYERNRQHLVKLIDFHMSSYPNYTRNAFRDEVRLTKEYFSCDNLLKAMFND